MPYQEYLQQWDSMAVEGRREEEVRMTGDGRERGSWSRKMQKAGFDFWT